ncbi:hypothetical protein GCM10023345_01990 [Acinetobacter kookii]|uniref:VanZ like family protein n=1 Tax=Acinetobacter kookii TaxID=1226327 RepID=A0A1G6HMN2_9GAMM|nr:hypothetical protein [Acinetobacter kookii]SDB95510.1 hypothetical protein SAMN05421732_102107 [Acinetobacter kookii]
MYPSFAGRRTRVYGFIEHPKNKISVMYLSKFQELKIYIVNFTELSRDALHIYTGLTLFFIVAFFHHRQLKSKWAIWTVLIVAIAAELFDARDDLINHGLWRIGASLHDIINTIFWPLLIWLMARFRLWKG